MESKDFNKRFGDNSIMAPFMCGHSHIIYYNGSQTLKARLAQAEKSLCPDCKKKKLKKENEHIFVPYTYYKEHLKKARNIVVGEYDKETKEIELWVPKNKAAEYAAERIRRYYEINNTPPHNNESTLTILIKGNTRPIKDKLKELGARWTGNYWVFIITVQLEIDDRYNVWIPAEKNPEYYDLRKKLEALDCIADYSKVSW